MCVCCVCVVLCVCVVCDCVCVCRGGDCACFACAMRVLCVGCVRVLRAWCARVVSVVCVCGVCGRVIGPCIVCVWLFGGRVCVVVARLFFDCQVFIVCHHDVWGWCDGCVLFV